MLRFYKRRREEDATHRLASYCEPALIVTPSIVRVLRAYVYIYYVPVRWLCIARQSTGTDMQDVPSTVSIILTVQSLCTTLHELSRL